MGHSAVTLVKLEGVASLGLARGARSGSSALAPDAPQQMAGKAPRFGLRLSNTPEFGHCGPAWWPAPGGGYDAEAVGDAATAMGIFARYVFRQAAAAFLLILLSLCSVVWIALALRQLNVVTNPGSQSVKFNMLQNTSIERGRIVMVTCPGGATPR